MLILSERDVKACLDMPTCLAVNRKALIAVATGDAVAPSRLALPYGHLRTQPSATSSSSRAYTISNVTPAAEDWSLFKPASLQHSTSSPSIMGIKVVSVRADNPARGYPLVPATVLHMNPVTGMVDAILAGTFLTGARTAAGSALAVQHYFGNSFYSWSEKQLHIVIFGAGLQAEQHVQAFRAAIDSKKTAGNVQPFVLLVTIVNRSLPRAQQLQKTILMINDDDDGTTTRVATCRIVLLHDKETIGQVLRTANVIVTCTNAISPLWEDDLTECIPSTNCIITGIGSYTANMQEVPASTVDRCTRVWIDTPEAASVGDLKHLFTHDDDSGSEKKAAPTIQLLGEVLHNVPSTGAITDGLVFYKAVGTAIQDVLTADAVVLKARELNIGTEVDMA